MFFSCQNTFSTGQRGGDLVPVLCDGPIPVLKMVPSPCKSFRQAIGNDVSYSCALKRFVYCCCLCELGLYSDSMV